MGWMPDSLTPSSGRLLLLYGGFDRWRSRREAEALKDGPDGLRRMDGRENPHAREAAGAFENVNSPDSAHQLGPGVVTRPCSGGLLAGIPRLLGYRRLRGRTAAGFGVRSTAGMRRGIGLSHWIRRHDLRPRVGCGREHAVVTDEIESRRRHERRELFRSFRLAGPTLDGRCVREKARMSASPSPRSSRARMRRASDGRADNFRRVDVRRSGLRYVSIGACPDDNYCLLSFLLAITF